MRFFYSPLPTDFVWKLEVGQLVFPYGSLVLYGHCSVFHQCINKLLPSNHIDSLGGVAWRFSRSPSSPFNMVIIGEVIITAPVTAFKQLIIIIMTDLPKSSSLFFVQAWSLSICLVIRSTLDLTWIMKLHILIPYTLSNTAWIRLDQRQ